MRNRWILYMIFVMFCQKSMAQKIDNFVSFRDIQSSNYFRFSYDNDYFAATDENYTQGYSFELISNVFKTNPINLMFYTPKEVEIRYGLAVEHIGFTPNRYELSNIQFGDRPFASAIMLKSFIIATDQAHVSRLTASFSFGVLGPAAFGEEMQVGIHKATGNKIPLGWRHQIKNDLVINYEIDYEKQLLSYRKLFSLQANARAKIGTLFTNGSLGANTTFGLINSPFSTIKRRGGFKLYGYVQSVVRVIGYDATLQGGVFNRKSAYVISASDVARFTGQVNYGVVLRTKTLYFEYSRSILTKEFATGSSAKWGGIKVGLTL